MNTLELITKIKDLKSGKIKFETKEEYLETKNEIKQRLDEDYCLRDIKNLCYHIKDKNKFIKVLENRIENGLLGQLKKDNMIDDDLKNIVNIALFYKIDDTKLDDTKYSSIRNNFRKGHV